MAPSSPVLRARPGARPRVTLRYAQHELVEAHEGDTVSAALLGAGILSTSRSIKYRRHRGPYCLSGDCGTCLVRIDGIPNVRACMTEVAEGMQVDPQNLVVEVGPDPSALADKVFAHGMDHHHFMVRPRIANVVMQGVARNLAGLGTLPDRPPSRPATLREHRPDLLIVGAGPAGRAAATVGRRHGLQVLHVDRLGRAALEAGPALPRQNPTATATIEGVVDSTGIFGAYPDEGVWAALTRRRGQPDVLRRIRPHQVILTTGARDPMLPIEGNDVPGVVSARGLLSLLHRCDAELAVPCVVIGRGRVADHAAEALGAELVDPEQVERIEGRRAVSGVRLRDRTIDCGIVALAPIPAPAHELAVQAGAAVRFDGAGFRVERDEDGRCPSRGPWALWAAGDVCGYTGPRRAAEDGREVAEAAVNAREGR